MAVTTVRPGHNGTDGVADNARVTPIRVHTQTAGPAATKERQRIVNGLPADMLTEWTLDSISKSMFAQTSSPRHNGGSLR